MDKIFISKRIYKYKLSEPIFLYYNFPITKIIQTSLYIKYSLYNKF